MDYQIAIPSYKRERTIIDKTLNVLFRYNIDPKKIKVFVNDEEPDEYEK